MLTCEQWLMMVWMILLKAFPMMKFFGLDLRTHLKKDKKKGQLLPASKLGIKII